MKKNDSEKKLSKHVNFRRLDLGQIVNGKIAAICKNCVLRKKSRTGNGRLQQSAIDSRSHFGTTNRYVIFRLSMVFTRPACARSDSHFAGDVTQKIIYECLNPTVNKNLIFFRCRRHIKQVDNEFRATKLIALVSPLALALVSHIHTDSCN